MSLVTVSDLTKHFRILNRKQGVFGAISDLFSRDYSVIKAVDCISMSIEAGEIVGFIGPNGAGKSTTIKMLTGVLEPTSGNISAYGFTPYKQRERYVKNIGVVIGQRTQLWWDLPVIESFRILKEIYEIDKISYEENLGRFDRLLNLKALYRTPVRKLSLGQRTLCDIAAAFLHDPAIIFLDEPTIGLDISVKNRVREIIRELNREKGTTVIITSHDIGDIESLSKRVVLIDKGKIIFDGNLTSFSTILGRYRTLRIELKNENGNANPEHEKRIRELAGNVSDITIRRNESGWIEVTVNEEEIGLFALLEPILKSLPVKDVKIEEMALEDVIRKVYEGALE